MVACTCGVPNTMSVRNTSIHRGVRFMDCIHAHLVRPPQCNLASNVGIESVFSSLISCRVNSNQALTHLVRRRTRILPRRGPRAGEPRGEPRALRPQPPPPAHLHVLLASPRAVRVRVRVPCAGPPTARVRAAAQGPPPAGWPQLHARHTHRFLRVYIPSR